MVGEEWAQFSRDYDDKVFSLTKIPERRAQILERMKGGMILNMGCGSADYLNRDLVERGNVVASDFCADMLNVARENFTHPNLEYRLADSRIFPFRGNMFDSVISSNSILPPERKDVDMMGESIYRVLKKDGVFVGFLPSYDSTKKVKDYFGLDIELDENQMRVMDTTNWQCFHTPDSIERLMIRSGFSKYDIEKVCLDTRQEISELERLYGVDTSESPVYEYLVVARK